MRFQVNRKIKVVVSTLVISVQKREHICELDFGRNVFDHEGRQAENLLVPSFVRMDYPAKVNLIVFGSDEDFLLLLLNLFAILWSTVVGFPLRKILLHQHSLFGLAFVRLHLCCEIVIALLDTILIKLFMLGLLVKKQLLVCHGVILIVVVLLDQWVRRTKLVATGLLRLCMSGSIPILLI